MIMASVILCVCVCVRALKEKNTRAINTKLCTHILYGRISARNDPEVKTRSKVKVTRLSNVQSAWILLRFLVGHVHLVLTEPKATNG